MIPLPEKITRWTSCFVESWQGAYNGQQTVSKRGREKRKDSGHRERAYAAVGSSGRIHQDPGPELGDRYLPAAGGNSPACSSAEGSANDRAIAAQLEPAAEIH
jgi:hypothetical protein